MPNEPICPEGSNVLVEVDAIEDVTPGGIVVPDIAKENNRQLCTTGTLVGMGPATTLAFHRGGENVEVTREMLPLRVLYSRYGGTPVRTGNRQETQNFRLLTEQDITAFLFDDIVTPREV